MGHTPALAFTDIWLCCLLIQDRIKIKKMIFLKPTDQNNWIRSVYCFYSDKTLWKGTNKTQEENLKGRSCMRKALPGNKATGEEELCWRGFNNLKGWGYEELHLVYAESPQELLFLWKC